MNQLSPSQWSVKQKHFLRSTVWINAFILPRRRQHNRLVTLRAVDFVQTGQLESVGQWIICSLPVLGTARQPTVFFYWGPSLLSLWRCDNRKWAGHPGCPPSTMTSHAKIILCLNEAQKRRKWLLVWNKVVVYVFASCVSQVHVDLGLHRRTARLTHFK